MGHMVFIVTGEETVEVDFLVGEKSYWNIRQENSENNLHMNLVVTYMFRESKCRMNSLASSLL